MNAIQEEAGSYRLRLSDGASSRNCQANVAALTRESPSEARVSSVFNAQLGSA
jgi:hypothetical protein